MRHEPGLQLKVISGGQTGVDRGALDAAIELAVECGGCCPAGRLAEDGTIPERYPVTEMPTTEYSARTKQNVRDSDATIIICNGTPIGGTAETLELCRQLGKPHLVIDSATLSIHHAIDRASEFISALWSRAEARDLTTAHSAAERLRGSSLPEFMQSQQSESNGRLGMVVNVAGPRASQWAEGHDFAKRVITAVLRALLHKKA